MSVAIRRWVTALTAVWAAGDLTAAVLHVRECLRFGDTVVDVVDTSVSSGESHRTQRAPAIGGFVFTHWSVDADQAVAARDGWGRSMESASFKVYEDTVATANYMPAAVDEDGDGIPDGQELYWYGNLAQDAASDTDGDGCPFADELRLLRNPHFPEEKESGMILALSSDDLLYNPHGYAPYVLRSEPEGALFETRRVYATPGEVVRTESLSPAGSTFSYWTVNGRRAADDWGVASNVVSFVASDKVYMECVAHSAGDAVVRNAGYWYGFAAAADSDVDGDGYTFGEELALGLSPVFKDEVDSGRILSLESPEVLFNPHGYVPYTIKCEPEGALFETISDWRLPGAEVKTPQFDPRTTAFAYWQKDGTRCQDDWGVAVDSVSFVAQSNAVSLVAVAEDDAWKRLSLYWYGDREHGPDSDADGDGFTFRTEVGRGLSPVFADELDGGRVLAFASESAEVSLQGFEQARGVIVDGKYVELFTSPTAGNGATSVTFANGSQVWPVVVDLNDDGLFDLMVASEGGVRVFVNVGRKGNPGFVESEAPGAKGEEWWKTVLAMNSTEKLAGMTLDVQPTGALSATVWGEGAMLVSDDAGRIWYYRNCILQHKVWGGSYAGFANGLMLAAVDWDDDGDLDCLCGTAEGKLMLLRDPKVGRPTNLRALAGVDNVLLEWDPNVQSRVRGYRVYRNEARTGGEGERWNTVASSALPTYRDYPPEIRDYDYRVTSVSRFYTAGNSTPTVTESMPTEPVRAELGKVSLRWSDAAGFDNGEIAVSLGIENSLNVAGEGLMLAIAYDPAVLSPVRVETSGLTEKVKIEGEGGNGMWAIRATGGEIAAGGGTLFAFVFKPAPCGEGTAGTVSSAVGVTSATMKSVGGATIPVGLPAKDAVVTVMPFIEPEPVHAAVTVTESVQVAAGESFAVSVVAAGEGVDASSLAYEYVFDTALLSRSGDTFTAADVSQVTLTAIALTNVSVRASDGSAAVVDSVSLCAVAISPKAGGGEDGGDVDETDEIIRDQDGNIVDWGRVPCILDPDFRFGRRLAGVRLGAAKGRTGDVVEIPVGICNEDVVSCGLLKETTVDVRRWAFEVRYDERLVKPVGIVAGIGSYAWSETNGVLTVVGLDGAVELGRLLMKWKEPLKLRFELLTQYAEHRAALAFGAVQARTTDGRRVYTPIRGDGSVAIKFVRPPEDPTVVVPFGLGDLNGDGRLTKADKQILAQLMNGSPSKPKWNERQLAAGDYNGNGRLDQDDYQKLKDDFKAKGIE